MDKTLTLGLLLTAKDAFSPVFSSFKSSLGNMTKGTKEFSTAMSGIGTGLKGASLATQGTTETIIKSFVELEDARTQLENTLMKSDGSVSPFFKSINDQAMQLGDALPGTTADFYKMASTLKSLGVQEESIIGGALKSAAYLGVVLKIPYEEAATATAKFKEALGIADDELLPFIDDIQRLSHMGVQVGEMSFAFSKVGATMKGLGMSGLKAARDVEPLIGMLIKSGFSGETVGTNLGNIIKDAVSFKGNKNLDAMGIKLNFTDAEGNFKGTASMIKELEKLKAIKSDTARLSVIESIFGKGEASGMVNVLIQKGTKGVAEFNQQMAEQADLNARVKNSSQTLGNMWEALTGTASNFTAIIGESLSPELKGMTEWFNKATSSLSSFAKEHPGVTKFVGVAIVGFTVVTGVLGTLGVAVGALAYGIGVLKINTLATAVATWAWNTSLVANSVSILGMIGRVIVMGGILTAIGLKIAAVTAYQWLLNTAISANPIGALIIGFTALVGVGVLLYKHFKPFKDLIDDINKGFYSAVDWIATIGIDVAAKPKQNAALKSNAAVRNPRVAAARGIPTRGGTNNTVHVNITNPNFTSKEHAAQTQKQIDEQVRRAMNKQANDKKDRSYS